MNAGSCLRLLLIRLSAEFYRRPFDLKDIVNLGLKKRQGVLENRLELCGAIPGTIFGSQLWLGKSRQACWRESKRPRDILRSRGGPNNANGMRWTAFSGSANRWTALVELLRETGAGD